MPSRIATEVRLNQLPPASYFTGLLTRSLDAVQSCKNLRASAEYNANQHLLSNTAPQTSKRQRSTSSSQASEVAVPMLHCNTATWTLHSAASHLSESGSKENHELTPGRERDLCPPEQSCTGLMGSRGSNRLVNYSPWECPRGNEGEKMNPKWQHGHMKLLCAVLINSKQSHGQMQLWGWEGGGGGGKHA